MPTFTTIALENLLESSVRISLKKHPVTNDDPDPNPDPIPKPRHLYISPSLYATPEQASIVAYSPPQSISPSPYVANNKRRRAIGNENERKCEVTENGGGFNLEEEVVEDNFVNSDELVVDEDESDCEFVDVFESMSVGSEAGSRRIESRSFVSAQGDFFDANDDFSSDGSISSSFGVRTESEINALRSSLHVEIERRKNAEQTLYLMHCQWNRIAKLMSDAGFTFPAPPPVNDNSMLLENNDMDQFSQEVAVTRFVAEAIGRGEARAEAEEAFASIVESKDQEILRLRDRLQYYETVNHEMSQRKLVEVARRQQQRKKSRRSWMWSLSGLSVATGASLVAAYLSGRSSNSSTDISSASKTS